MEKRNKKMEKITPDMPIEKAVEMFDSLDELFAYIKSISKDGRKTKRNDIAINDADIEKCCEFISKFDSISITTIQREYGYGFPKAARIIDELENRGYIEMNVNRRGGYIVKRKESE